MTDVTTVPDWKRWYQRWEAQQSHHMPDRDERFAAITGALGAVVGDAPRVVDLGSGPGSLARRVLDALPGSRVVAVDMDPVLLAIGQNALGDAGGRLSFVDADLRDPWEEALDGQVDAVVSTTALHWLQPDSLADLYRRVATVVRPGGVLINGDSLAFDDAPAIAGAVQRLREQRHVEQEAPGGESWEEWWDAAAAEPGFAAEIAERSKRHHDHPEHSRQAGYGFHRTALLEAGFREVATTWQKLTDRVLVAIR